jgi:hypothetical protein
MHVSFKLRLTDWPDLPLLPQRLRNALNADILSSGAETDSIYHLFTNSRGDVSLKLRHSFQGADAIFERVATLDDSGRTSLIAFADLREGKRDSALPDILGAPDHKIAKDRTIYTLPDYPGVRLYFDTVGNERFLEVQLPQDAPADWADRITGMLGLRDRQRLSDSYVMLALKSRFADSVGFPGEITQVPDALMSAICLRPAYRARTEHRLLRQGDDACNAFLIRKGHAHIKDGAISLGAGQLVGEFGIIEGRRSDHVDVSADFEAYVLGPKLVRNLLVLPGFSRKYMDWKLAA